jgi:hypothetical protein
VTKTIDLAFDEGQAYAYPVIPSAEYPAAYTHDDGSVETHFRIGSMEIERPAAVRGEISVRLAGASSAGEGTIDLMLSPEAAERIGVALIRAASLTVGSPESPSRN